MKVDFDYSEEYLKDYYTRHLALGLEEEVWLNGFRYKVIDCKPVLFDISNELLSDYYDKNIFIIPDVFQYIDVSYDGVHKFRSYFKHFYVNNDLGFTFIANGLLSLPDDLFENTPVKMVFIHNCEFLGTTCFQSTSYLDKVLCPNVKIISDLTFSYSNINSINIENVEFIGSSAFYNTPRLHFENEFFPNLVHMSDKAFVKCENIKKMIVPKLDYVSSECFKYSGIESFIGHSVLKLYNEAFKSSKLSYIEIPNIKVIGSEAFKMTNLESFELYNNKYIYFTF